MVPIERSAAAAPASAAVAAATGLAPAADAASGPMGPPPALAAVPLGGRTLSVPGGAMAAPGVSSDAAAPSGAAKLAAFGAGAGPGSQKVGYSADKSSGDIGNQTVTSVESGVGTGVAKEWPTMIAAAPLPSAAPLVGGSAPAGAPAVLDDPGRPATPASAAGAAVESALQIGDFQAQAQGNQSAVNLRFKVGGENLSVSVAVQAGQVHAQFNTDSGELRTALASAWPSVAAAPGAPRFAEPVFTAGTGGGGAATDLGGGARQGSGQQAPADDDLGPGAIRLAGVAEASEPGDVSSLGAGGTASAGLTGPRLQTFA